MKKGWILGIFGVLLLVAASNVALYFLVLQPRIQEKEDANAVLTIRLAETQQENADLKGQVANLWEMRTDLASQRSILRAVAKILTLEGRTCLETPDGGIFSTKIDIDRVNQLIVNPTGTVDRRGDKTTVVIDDIYIWDDHPERSTWAEITFEPKSSTWFGFSSGTWWGDR